MPLNARLGGFGDFQMKVACLGAISLNPAKVFMENKARAAGLLQPQPGLVESVVPKQRSASSSEAESRAAGVRMFCLD